MAKTEQERIGINETEIDNLKQSDSEQWGAINELRKVLQKLIPVWVTVALMVMSAITGSALTYAGLVIRMGNK